MTIKNWRYPDLNRGSPAHETGVLTRLNYSAITKRTEFYFKKLSLILIFPIFVLPLGCFQIFSPKRVREILYKN